MRHLQELLEYHETICHPARELGQFLMDHSNSSDYLVGVLGAYLEVAKADVEEARRWHSIAMATMKRTDND